MQTIQTSTAPQATAAGDPPPLPPPLKVGTGTFAHPDADLVVEHLVPTSSVKQAVAAAHNLAGTFAVVGYENGPGFGELTGADHPRFNPPVGPFKSVAAAHVALGDSTFEEDLQAVISGDITLVPVPTGKSGSGTGSGSSLEFKAPVSGTWTLGKGLAAGTVSQAITAASELSAGASGAWAVQQKFTNFITADGSDNWKSAITVHPVTHAGTLANRTTEPTKFSRPASLEHPTPGHLPYLGSGFTLPHGILAVVDGTTILEANGPNPTAPRKV